MTQPEAKKLIEEAGFKNNEPEKWLDLGCGSGLFSDALAELLPEASEVLMIDKVNQAPIKSAVAGVHFEFLQIDFNKQALPNTGFDGIMMANSLHYVRNKKPFVQKLKKNLSDNGRLILVEYNTEVSNPWIPHPIPLNRLEELFLDSGFEAVRKIGERPSRYGQKNMYAVEVLLTNDQ
ncbi:class I SAM-dependent methyltransferase [Gracilimonas sp. BCB1]|uniref:class I SAM-dependent methyltransferase n=1 Tax=Gracilimonas sp. BCB1 TaxID=3152362 RepID=UPI0032D8D554